MKPISKNVQFPFFYTMGVICLILLLLFMSFILNRVWNCIRFKNSLQLLTNIGCLFIIGRNKTAHDNSWNVNCVDEKQTVGPPSLHTPNICQQIPIETFLYFICITLFQVWIQLMVHCNITEWSFCNCSVNVYAWSQIPSLLVIACSDIVLHWSSRQAGPVSPARHRKSSSASFALQPHWSRHM